MSAIVAVTGSNYALMSGDGRAVEYKDGKVIRILSETTKKVIRVNKSICVGITGDFFGFQVIADVIETLDKNSLNISNLTGILCEHARTIPLTNLPLNILIAGKGENSAFIIAEMASTKNNYFPTAYVSTSNNTHQVRCSIPKFGNAEINNMIDKRIERLVHVETINELQTRTESLIKSIANKSSSVNKNVTTEIIT